MFNLKYFFYFILIFFLLIIAIFTVDAALSNNLKGRIFFQVESKEKVRQIELESEERMYKTNENLNKQYGKISITGKEIILPTQKCYVDYNLGGPVIHWLIVDFSNFGKGNITFSVRDSKNNKDNLLVPGVYTATGEGDSYSNYLDGYSWLLEPEDMAVVLEEINMGGSNESFASGYIDIKRKITQSCAKEAWIDGQNIKLGEPGYISCGWEDLYLEPQKIYFKCSL